MIPAILKWIGNKQRFAETIVSYMPQEFNDYYEPFLGSGAVMAELLYSDGEKLMPHFKWAYGSDILPFLVDIFILTKENPEKLIEYYRKEITEYYLLPEKNIMKLEMILMRIIILMIFYFYPELVIQVLFDLENQMAI